MASSQTLSGNKFGNSNNVHQGDNIYNGCQVVQAENDLDNVYLRDLSQTDPRLDKMRILETKGPLLRESYSWILGHRDFKRWLDAQNGILWIKGDPGKGKTMILCGVIESLEENNDTEDDIAYFFCQATDSRINTAAAILGGLTFGLARRKTSLLSYVREKHLSPGKSLFDGTNGWVAICDIFETVIHDSALSRIVLIVDALDECVTTDRDSFLRLVVRTSSRVKWLLSSRNLEDIQRQLLSKDSVNPLSLELKENAESVSQAVHSYIDHCVADMKIIQDNEELGSKVRDTLKRKANDTFLWVALAIQQLQGALKWEVLRKLDQMPEGLQSLYQSMMNRIKVQPSERRKICVKLLLIVTAAQRPLHLGELSSLWQKEADTPESQEDFRTVAQLCGSFLTVKDDIIYFIHQSAKDFVLERGSQAGIATIHYYIFKSSLDTMSKSLHRNIYGLQSPGTRVRSIAAPCPDPLAYIRYQCIFWIDHLLAASEMDRKKSIENDGNLHNFFTKVYLYWLEALSLLRSMDHPVAKMYELDALIQQQGSAGLRARKLRGLSEDAIRFIQYNRGIIETVPLQTYFSAVAFAPECSLIRKAFISNGCDGVPCILNRPKSWGPCVQTLFGHEDRISSLAFSPNSQILVSTSHDGTARIWETKTGNCRRILSDENGFFFDVKFSPDSKQMVYMDMEKICLWNTDTGEKMHTLYSDGKVSSSVAFASNSKLLASAHYDMSVCIWCTETGNLLQTLPPLLHYTRRDFSFALPRRVAFSPELKFVAVGDPAAVTVWDIKAVKEVRSFPHGSHRSLKNIAFSPNSKLLASVEWSYDYRYRYGINIWCITTGRKLKSYQDGVCEDLVEEKLVFASNTELIITTRYGIYRWQFEPSSDMVFVSDIEPLSVTDLSSNLAFFAGSEETGNIIRIWQLPPGDSRVVFPKKDHLTDSEYLCINISPDSSVVALWSITSTTITLQRTDLGECFAICKGHHDEVSAIAFSSDSSILISCDEKRILRLWKLATGECIDILSMMEVESRDENFRVNQIRVSADMGIIACGEPRDIFILRKNDGKEYTCIANYSAPYFFNYFISDATTEIEISSNSVFVTWRAATNRRGSRREEHWRVNINESIDFSHMPYRYSLNKRGREQAYNKVYTIPYIQQWRRETDNSQFSWVTKNNERLIWIPKEFRPQSENHWDSSGSAVVIGMSLDLTIVIDFSRQPKSIIGKDDETKILKRKREDSDAEAAI